MTRRDFLREYIVARVWNANDTELFDIAQETFPVMGSTEHGACNLCNHQDTDGNDCYCNGLCTEAITAWMDKEKEDWLHE